MQRLYEINKIERDEFGRPSGILLLNKKKWITSHDLVDEVRKKFETRKVGHAGTLDPFATGLVIILIGKATKQSVDFLTLGKEYNATVLFGASTNTGDVEGEIQNISSSFNLSKDKLEDVIKSLEPSYIQYVPVFSSVKIQGKKLRKLAHAADKFEIVDLKPDGKEVIFYNEDGSIRDKINLPKKLVTIKTSVNSLRKVEVNELKSHFNNSNSKNYSKLKQGKDFYIADITVDCSKGTYIRQLAVDIGVKLGIPSMLVELERTRIGDYKSESAIEL